MAKYILYVYCRRDGVSRDSGEQARCNAENDDEAYRVLAPKASGLKRLGRYDVVGCTIMQDERTVHRFSV